MNKFLKLKVALMASAIGLASGVASAADVDVSEGIATISSGGVAIAAIGGAMVGLGILIVVYRKLRNP